MHSKLTLTTRGKRLVYALEFIAGVNIYVGLIFGAAVLEKIVQ